MKFSQYLKENSLFDSLNQKSPDSTQNYDKKIVDRIYKSVNNLNLEVFKDNLYVSEDNGKKFGGFFIYTLNEDNENYTSDKYDLPPIDYFYIGKYVYDLALNKIEEIKESTVDRHKNISDAIRTVEKYKVAKIGYSK